MVDSKIDHIGSQLRAKRDTKAKADPRAILEALSPSIGGPAGSVVSASPPSS